MTTNRSFSLLKELPDEILCNIGDYLKLRDLNQIVRTCYQLHSLFQQEITVVELLRHVINADYGQATKIVQKNPALMFVSVQDPNDPSKLITPLKLAFKNYDTIMWKKTFFAVIKANPADVTEFFKQKEEQTEQISLDSLFAAYEVFNQQIDEADNHWFEVGDLETYEVVDLAWLDVGREQKKIPKHFLKTFCSQPSWHSSTFNADTATRSTSSIISEYNTSSTFDLLAEDNFSNLGVLFSCARANSKVYAVPLGQWVDPTDPAASSRSFMRWVGSSDTSAFGRLFKMRKAELSALDSGLILSPTVQRSWPCTIS